MVTHKTRGIVVKVVRYGETSIIASIYTELFGLQSYLLNGVRSSSKKSSGKANVFQPSAILDLVVYHHEFKNLQRIKEFRWAIIYERVFFNVFTNAVAMFMIELLQRTLKQPEGNPDLYSFLEDALIHLDKSENTILANFPLYFALHLSSFYGFRPDNKYSATNIFLDLKEGEFLPERPLHSFYLEKDHSAITSELLKTMHPSELEYIKLNKETRRILLHAYEKFYALHMQDFGSLKTLPVLETVLS